jgi:hypothetical protein
VSLPTGARRECDGRQQGDYEREHDTFAARAPVTGSGRDEKGRRDRDECNLDGHRCTTVGDVAAEEQASKEG